MKAAGEFVLPPSSEKLPRDVLDSVIMDFIAAREAVEASPTGMEVLAQANSVRLAALGKSSKSGFLPNLSVRVQGSINDHLNPMLIQMVEGWNSRHDNDENRAWIDQLARSIAKVGVKNPVVIVVDGEGADRVIKLTDGHMRLFGTMRAIHYYGAKIFSIPYIVENKFASEADRVARQLLTGKSLTVMEQGEVFVKLCKLGWTVDQIADVSGIGKQRITSILAFMEQATPAIKEMVSKGFVSSNMAEKVMQATETGTEAETVLNDAVKEAKKQGKDRALPKHVKGKAAAAVRTGRPGAAAVGRPPGSGKAGGSAAKVSAADNKVIGERDTLKAQTEAFKKKWAAFKTALEAADIDNSMVSEDGKGNVIITMSAETFDTIFREEFGL